MTPDRPDAFIRRGEIAARKITRKYAKTFYFASHLLSRKRRYGAYCLYAVCRISDESVDADCAGQGVRLENIRRSIESAYANSPLSNPILAAFRETVTTYNVPRQLFDGLIAGMRLDLEKNRYADFAQLYEYCYKVAGVVGLMMVHLLGYTDPQAKSHAVELGVAMQLTNILRDIPEDFSRGRIYIPQDELRSFGVSEKSIAEKNCDDNFSRLLQFQVVRAKGYYDRALKGTRFLGSRSSQLVILAMASMYSGILDKIEARGYNVFARRAYLNFFEQAWRLIKVLLKMKYL